MQLLEDFPDFSLWTDAACHCLCASWRGRHTDSLMRQQYELIHRHAQEQGCTKLLNDSLQDEDGWVQATNWIAGQGFQQLAELGVQAVAWVLPRHPVAYHDTMQVLRRMQRPLVDTFTDAQAAYDWLLRWPTSTTRLPSEHPQLLATAFLLLPPAEQLALAAQYGRYLAPRWEADFYIKPYELPDGLLVEVAYHLHSGIFYQVQVRSK